MPRIARVMPGSAMRVNAEALRVWGGQGERDNWQIIRVKPSKNRFFHLRGKIATDSGNRVTDVLCRRLNIFLENELDHHRREAIERGRVDVLDATDARNRFFDPVKHFLLNRHRRGARIRNGHGDNRRLNLRKLVRFQEYQRKDAE